MGLRRPGIAIIAVTILLLAVGSLFPVADRTAAAAGWMRDAGGSGVLFFIAVYIGCALLLLPGSLLTVVAGFAYGPAVGVLVASPASVLAATASFLLGRTIFRERIRRSIGASSRAAVVSRAVGHEGFKLVLLLRLSPLIPFNVLNYALGLSEVTLGRYVLASFLGMLPGTCLYVYLGSLATTAAELSTAGSGSNSQRAALAIVGLVATAAAAGLATHVARRALSRELQSNGAGACVA